MLLGTLPAGSFLHLEPCQCLQLTVHMGLGEGALPTCV